MSDFIDGLENVTVLVILALLFVPLLAWSVLADAGIAFPVLGLVALIVIGYNMGWLT